MTDARRKLRDVFHIEDFRPGQRETVQAILNGRDVCCVLPTGAGKSLCYQLPAAVLPGFTLVISPLIALMADQTAHLRELGLPAAMLSSGQTPEDRSGILASVRAGSLKMLFVSPERLKQPGFQSFLIETPPTLCVVDEAHCVVRWGRDFRPPYAEIGDMIRLMPRRPVICAMTATADRRTRRGIIQSLGLKRPLKIVLPVYRPNLQYAAHITLHRNEAIDAVVRRHAGERGVIICSRIDETEKIAARLRTQGVAADAYHAGLSREERDRRQEAFRTGRILVLSATVAFGMGVDIPDIRYTVHETLPMNPEDLLQESGRAGRDGKPAECVVLLDPAGLWQRWRNIRSDKNRGRRIGTAGRLLRKDARDLDRLTEIFLSGRCIPQQLSATFGQRIAPCGACSACMSIKNGRPGRLAPRLFLSGASREEIRRWWLLVIRERASVLRKIPAERILPLSVIYGVARAGYASPDLVKDEQLRRECSLVM